MTNIESDLRDLLRQDAERGEATGGGVTVAGVDKRARGIRRRRLALLGGIAGAGLAVAATLTLPVTGTTGSRSDVWTGVMAAPSPSYGVVSVSRTILDQRFTQMGERVAFDIPRKTDRGSAAAMIYCPRGAELLYWEDGVYRNALVCSQWLPSEDKDRANGVELTARRGSRLEVAVLPAGSVARLDRTLVTGEDARRVLELSDRGRADMRLTVTDMWVEPCDSGPDCAPAPEDAPRPSPGVTITPVYPTAGAPSGGG
ncbi:hypothetical protein ACFY19_23365 [Streptosporangium saharense]|uniref:hypothetical protein n=1 Tax=Streptosporangium saharense TaxID=1706840 RepID=UPI00367886A7